MIPRFPFTLTRLLAVLSTAVAATAQDQATTFAALAPDADVVVVATATEQSDPSSDWHRIGFSVDQVLRGTIGAEFALLEPAGQCCGRTLFALGVGDRRLLFLRRTGAALHLLGGARGAAEAGPEVVQHVTALLSTSDAGARTRLLAESLGAGTPRIADDAAMALAATPNLTVTPAEQSMLLEALRDSVQRGMVRTAALAEAATRVAHDDAIDGLLPLFLEAEQEDQARTLGAALARNRPNQVALRLPLHLGEARSANVRAARLLGALPPEIAAPTMATMLARNGHPQVQLHLCEGLLAAGSSRAQLTALVPGAVLDLAERRRNRPKALRNVDPTR